MKLSFLSLVFVLTATVYAQNCAPLNCVASCTPSCSSQEVCTLSTMVTCGVCPGSKCLSRAALGLPPINNTTEPVASSNGSSGALIGGIVGGILGAGLLLCGGAFLFIRHRKKKNALPLAIRSQHLERTTVMDEEMQERMSGVIPVTFIPPSRPESSFTTVSESETPQSRYASYSTFAQQQNPFDDRPISNISNITSSTSRRGSMESTISHQQVATVAQATQVLRARPTIMRVNTIKDGVKRSGSLKTIKPEPIQPTTTNEENPFDDKNKVEGERKLTDSVVSAPGDGEITIFWNGS